MNPREKILAISAFAVTGLLLVVFIATKMLIGPADEYRQQAAKVALDVDKLETKLRMEGVYRDTLVSNTKRSYGDDPSTASEMSRAHLVKLIAKAGLSSDDLSMIPITGKSIKGGREVGWTFRIKQAPLERLTNFLYIVGADPHLHKIDTLVWAPVPGGTDLSLQGRFVTLVLDPVDAGKSIAIDPESLENKVALNSPERRWYGLISDRDIFRPYIKRPPPPPPPPVAVRTQTPPRVDTPPPPAAPTSTFQLVGLPTWNDEPEVVVKDTRTLKSTTYKVGQDFLGGEIVMVDYRPLPLPKKPLIISNSRVIVRVGSDYWAVELGQYLTDKYVLTGDRLPESLRAAAPASEPVKPQTAKPVDLLDDAPRTATGSEPVSQETGHAP